MSPTLEPGQKPSPFPRPAPVVESRLTRIRKPNALAMSTVAWLVMAFLTLWAGMDALGGDPDQRNAQDLSNQLGQGTVATATQVQPQDILALVVGVCVLAVLAALVLGKGWARHVLSLLGVAAVVVVAVGGHWEAALVFLAFVAAAVTLLAAP
jgi:hypothetical protein